MFSSYGKLATEVYDIDKPVGHSFGDVEYYLRTLKRISGSVLEPAVGSGRILIPLLMAGIDIDGIDNSEEMLASCSTRCAERNLRPKLFKANMQKFSFDKKYDAIIIPTGSFLLLENRDDAISALKCFKDHLKMEGELILDLFLPTAFDKKDIIIKTWETSEGSAITMENRLIHFSQLEQKSVNYLRYEKWKDGRLLDTELQKFVLRWFGIEEFKLILKEIGFSQIHITSNYQEDRSPKSDEDLVTFHAKITCH
ncbi:MAG: class I SAM-dependent methyltransferase [Oligoflexia bacterium]|nr:class I SAM-dependent methyltransferase [Oligoflexia bacterium]